jgi:hypothetical protein
VWIKEAWPQWIYHGLVNGFPSLLWLSRISSEGSRLFACFSVVSDPHDPVALTQPASKVLLKGTQREALATTVL